ncbi:hypothetical protein [Marinobacter salicampi]|uniref:hypothetical protein n=1 Tax=Marinobacter salicampi TaxID=435907 RepID=UPI00140A7DBF|nr:hypothetical protein [Marinobacter salicampi]
MTLDDLARHTQLLQESVQAELFWPFNELSLMPATIVVGPITLLAMFGVILLLGFVLSIRAKRPAAQSGTYFAISMVLLATAGMSGIKLLSAPSENWQAGTGAPSYEAIRTFFNTTTTGKLADYSPDPSLFEVALLLKASKGEINKATDNEITRSLLANSESSEAEQP